LKLFGYKLQFAIMVQIARGLHVTALVPAMSCVHSYFENVSAAMSFKKWLKPFT
jgi:hypothetical protein